MIDLEKKYQTRGGKEVKNLRRTDDLCHPYVLEGVVGGVERCWTKEGWYWCDFESGFDLVPAPVPVDNWFKRFIKQLFKGLI